jgi:hypothetical protein
MSDDFQASLVLLLIVAVGWLLLMAGLYASPAATLSLVTGCVWVYGKFSESRWVKAFSSNAGTLSIGLSRVYLHKSLEAGDTPMSVNS